MVVVLMTVLVGVVALYAALFLVTLAIKMVVTAGFVIAATRKTAPSARRSRSRKTSMSRSA